MDRHREPLPSRVEDLPDLPEAALDALDDGLRTLALEDLAPSVRRAIVDHLRLLLAWTRAINLTAIRDPMAAIRDHLLDSLTAVTILREHAVDAFIDLGSGGGYPGIPLAAAVPARRALLVESIAKKARFLETAAAVIGMSDRLEAFAGRAEVLARDPRHRERWPAVVARAVGSLGEVAELGLPLLAPDGLLVVWKTADLDDELTTGRRALDALGGGRAEILPVDPRLGLGGHVLVVVAKTGRTPEAYPRDPALRGRRPL